jgi:hypothetical protein
MASKTVTTDIKDDLRRGAIHIRQTADAIAEAEKQRAEAVQTGDLEICRKVDRRLADLSTDLRALEERQRWLAAARIKVDLAAAEQARTDAIDRVLQPQADAIIAKAERLERAVAELGAAYADLDGAVAAMYAKWPASVPKLPFYEFRLTDAKQRLSGACEYASAYGEFNRMPMWANTFGERTVPLAESVKRGILNYIRDLRAQPLPMAKEES